jgi:hypothetical protein
MVQPIENDRSELVGIDPLAGVLDDVAAKSCKNRQQMRLVQREPDEPSAVGPLSLINGNRTEWSYGRTLAGTDRDQSRTIRRFEIDIKV